MPRAQSHFEGREPFFEKILSRSRSEIVLKHIPENSVVLDLGCGFNGNLLRKLESTISHGVGLDISVDKNFDSEKINLIECNLNNPLPFPENEFDIVTSLANLEHMENPEQALKEIFRVLKPGGKLLLTVPSTFAKPVLEFLAFVRLVSKQEIKDHKNYFNKKILMRLCQQTSFRDTKHQYFQLGMNNFLVARK